MNKKLKSDIKSIFKAPEPENKQFFILSVRYPEQTPMQFFFSQVMYIRKRFWILSLTLVTSLLCLFRLVDAENTYLAVISSLLPLLSLIGIIEISKSCSYNMSELELSCKYNLQRITVIRLCIISGFYFVILSGVFVLLNRYADIGFIRLALYCITPFMLCCYLSLIIMRIIKSDNVIYLCSGVTIFLCVCVLELSQTYQTIYTCSKTGFWALTFILMCVLNAIEIKRVIYERTEIR